VRLAQGAGDRRDKDGAEIDPENDAGVREHPARACHDHAGDRGVENVLHFWVGRHEALQDKKHLMQFRRIGAEETE